MNNLEYKPELFVKLYKTTLGELIWEFLCSPETRARMEAATYLGYPALSVMGELLLAKFGDVITDNQAKQMCGHMTRQVMASMGYELAEEDVPLPCTVLFKTAARYKLDQ